MTIVLTIRPAMLSAKCQLMLSALYIVYLCATKIILLLTRGK